MNCGARTVVFSVSAVVRTCCALRSQCIQRPSVDGVRDQRAVLVRYSQIRRFDFAAFAIPLLDLQACGIYANVLAVVARGYSQELVLEPLHYLAAAMVICPLRSRAAAMRCKISKTQLSGTNERSRGSFGEGWAARRRAIRVFVARLGRRRCRPAGVLQYQPMPLDRDEPRKLLGNNRLPPGSLSRR